MPTKLSAILATYQPTYTSTVNNTYPSSLIATIGASFVPAKHTTGLLAYSSTFGPASSVSVFAAFATTIITNNYYTIISYQPAIVCSDRTAD